MRRRVPTLPGYVRFSDSTSFQQTYVRLCVHGRVYKMFVPGHALHEKGLKRQTSVGTLVSNLRKTALLVQVINRLSTAV